jgi:hypothetical protein
MYIFKALLNILVCIFKELNEVKNVYFSIEDSPRAVAVADAPSQTEQEDPHSNTGIKTNIKSEWTDNKNIKITLEIIVGSDGLGVFMLPINQMQQPQFPPNPPTPPRAPTPPPCPIPDPVDDTPTIDDFHLEIDFGDSRTDEKKEDVHLAEFFEE